MDSQDPVLDNGTQDPSTPDEELDLDLELEDEQDPKPQAGGEGKQRKKFEEMEKDELVQVAKQYHGRLQKAKKPVQPVIPKSGEDVREFGTRLSKVELLERKRQFAWEHNLSPDETDKVFSMFSQPTAETLKDTFVKAGLDALRAAKRTADATPSSSGRRGMVNGKSFSEMTEEERRKNW